MILPPKGWHPARFKFDMMNCVAVSRHTRWFKNVSVFGHNRLPTCILPWSRYHVTCSTRVSLRSDHVCCWLNQHKPRLTPLAHITLNLLDTTQFNAGYWLGGQGMKHVCATMLTTVHLHCTGLPIDAGIGGLQPVYSQHNAWFSCGKTWQVTVQCNA